MRRGDVWERRWKRHIVAGYAIAQHGVDPVVERRSQRRGTGHYAKCDIDDVVDRAAPFGKPAASPPMTPSGFGLADGGTATFSLSISDGTTLAG